MTTTDPLATAYAQAAEEAATILTELRTHREERIAIAYAVEAAERALSELGALLADEASRQGSNETARRAALGRLQSESAEYTAALVERDGRRLALSTADAAIAGLTDRLRLVRLRLEWAIASRYTDAGRERR